MPYHNNEEPMQRRKRRISLRNYSNPLVGLFKVGLDNKHIATWDEFTNILELENTRTFIDFFSGKQAIPKETLTKALDYLEIPTEVALYYVEEEVKYRIKQ